MPFQKGQSGNPNGRPPAPEAEELRKALKLAAKSHNKSFLEHFIERAYESDIVAVALAKKLLPDKLQGEGFAEIRNTIIYNSPDRKNTDNTTRRLPVEQG